MFQEAFLQDKEYINDNNNNNKNTEIIFKVQY